MASASAIVSRPLLLVLLGPAQAGKTALLAGLGQVVQTQPELLQGQFTDSAGGFQARRQHLYEQQPLPQLLTHELPFQYLPVHGSEMSGLVHEVDTDTAQALLVPKRGQPPPPLTSLKKADALLLVVDLAQPEEQREIRLIEVGRFLRQLEQVRSRNDEVGGLPVFVVLTRGDALAGPKDTLADWIEGLEQHKRLARERLQSVLQSGSPPRPTAFGRVEVNVWASAACHPALGGNPARAEPYGVAELFRQSLLHATRYRAACETSHRQLRGTFAVAVCLGLFFTLITLWLFGGTSGPLAPPSELEQKVRAWEKKEGSMSLGLRLRGLPRGLNSKKDLLKTFKDNPDFLNLPLELRELVTARYQELDDYIPYLDKVLAGRSPALARTDEELDQVEREMQNLAFPHPIWVDTDAGKLQQQRLADCRRIREKSKVAEDWYLTRQQQARDLWTFTKPPLENKQIAWKRWGEETARLVGQKDASPAERLNLPPNGRITAPMILSRQRLTAIKENTDAAVAKLKSLQNLLCALGLIEVPEKPAVLVIPADPAFTLSQAQERFALLEKEYPRHKEEFKFSEVPDPIRVAVREQAGKQLPNLLPGAQAGILREYEKTKDDQVTPIKRWSYVGRWLRDKPKELEAWEKLEAILGGLSDEQGRRRITELMNLLLKESIPLQVDRLEVEVPFDAGVSIPPKCEFVVTMNKQSHAFTLTNAGGVRDEARKRTRYTFEGKSARISYLPGMAFTGKIEFEAEGKKLQLIWDAPRNRDYAYDALRQSPRLIRPGDDKGTRLNGVTLDVSPTTDFPKIPDLLPSLP